MTARTRNLPALVVLMAAGLLLAQGTPSWGASKPSSKSQKTRASSAARDSGPADFMAGRFMLDAQDAYDRAQFHYEARRYDDAAAALEPAIRQLNDAMADARDARIRNAAGDLLKRCGSLRIAAVRKRDAALGLPPAGPMRASNGPGNSAADSVLAMASAPPPASPPDIPLPSGDEGDAPDDATLAMPAIDEGQNSIPLESHPMVDKWLDYFTGRGRPTFEKWLTRSGLYMDAMKKTLEREGVPTDLVHLVFVESGFNPQARSYAAAVGPWQFIRGTAKLFGLQVNSWVDERKDPEASTIAAARYLKHLYGLFNSWPLALASYNAGEGAVINAVRRQGTKDFWALKLPRQTKDYVPKFMAVLAISRDPARYGFDDVELSDPLAFDEVTIPGPVDLRALADACGTTTEEIRHLNPMFLRNAAPAKNDMVTIRVPDGSGERLMSSLEGGTLTLPKVSTPADPAVLRHKVRRHESLKSLSLNYGVPALTIARYNHIGRKSRLRVGRILSIPMGGGSSSGRRMAAGSSTGATTVQVRKGDTLAGIASRHGVTVADLCAVNGLSRKSIVRAGQRLKIPASS
jgi:membrane-bound lytic murein transglycosylase D